MNKKLILFAFLLLMAGCVPTPPLKSCPQIGLDTAHPNFQNRYDYATLGAFYNCSSQNVDIAAQEYGNFGLKRWTPPDTVKMNMQHKALDYQWNLWQQIYDSKLTPLKAQGLWLQFDSAQSAEMQQIKARWAEEDAEQAEADAEAAQDEDDYDVDQQNHNHQHKRRNQSVSPATTYTPAVSVPQPYTPSASDTHKQVQQQLKSEGIDWH